MIAIRPATAGDSEAVWRILEPVVRAGETLCLPRDMTREALLDYWFATGHSVFVAEVDSRIVGTYFLQPNQMGGGSHVANCGYVTDAVVSGKGVARAMCVHSLEIAKRDGFRAMQFNVVVSTNAPAVHLWQSLGFEIIGTTPGGFLHPEHGYVDTLILFREL